MNENNVNSRMQDKENKYVGSRSRKNRAKKRKNRIMNIVLVILIVVFVYSTYQVIMWLISDRQTKELEQGLFSNVVKEENNEDNEETITIDFEKLEEVNEDVIAWIKIEGTYINYPIMQGETDEYYLRKDINKKYNIAGSIFVDASTKSDFSDDNTVIYGHNMKNGRMFSNLLDIYNGKYGKDIYVEIYTKEGMNKYKVMASYIEKPTLPLIQKNFTDEEKENYINNAIEKSKIEFNCNRDFSKSIITLITCDTINTKRVVVQAIKE